MSNEDFTITIKRLKNGGFELYKGDEFDPTYLTSNPEYKIKKCDQEISFYGEIEELKIRCKSFTITQLLNHSSYAEVVINI